MSPSTDRKPTFQELPVEVLREVLLHLHPNDLPFLAAVNRHLRHYVPICIDPGLAKHHIAVFYHERYRGSGVNGYNGLPFDHPLLLEHMVTMIALYGVKDATVFERRWKKKSEELRLHHVAAMRKVVQRGLWPSPLFGDVDPQLIQALKAAVNLRSVDLLSDLREAFPEHLADVSDTLYRTFIFESASMGFADALALIPANHPILFERELSEIDLESLETLMDLAVRSGSLESVKILHELGSAVNEDFLPSPLHKAINTWGDPFNPEIIQFLLEHGADTEARYGGLTALLFVASDWRLEDHMEAIELLIASGADVGARDEKGWSALHHEAKRGKPECVQLLLDAGADVNAPNWRGQTPRHASIRNYAGTTNVLRSHGASVKETAPLVVPPLYAAIESNDCELLKSLIGAGESLCAPNFMSKPPLHFALEHAQAAAILLAAGADPNARCWGKLNALLWLARSGVEAEDAEKLLAVMLERGVDINARDLRGATALHYALRSGSMELFLLLLRTEGVDLSAEDEEENTWAHAAWESTGSLEWLREHAPDVWDQVQDLYAE
ncbi:hypothetical protein HDU96_003395, partial [Phlyctochytrium bullatum]